MEQSDDRTKGKIPVEADCRIEPNQENREDGKKD